MHYRSIAADSEPRNEAADAGCDRVEIIAPRAWVANPGLCESSLDLHQGLDVNEAEIDTVPADLLKDLFRFV